MALKFKKNPAPLTGALFVKNPKRRKKAASKKRKPASRKRRTTAKRRKPVRRKRTNAMKRKVRTNKRKNSLALKKRRNTLARRRRLNRARKNTGLGKVRSNRKRTNKRRNGTKKGMARKTARKAYMRKRKNGTRKGMKRRTARKAYMKRRNSPAMPMQIDLFKKLQRSLFGFKIMNKRVLSPVAAMMEFAGPSVYGMGGAAAITYSADYISGAVSYLNSLIPNIVGVKDVANFVDSLFVTYRYAATGLVAAALVHKFAPLKPHLKKNISVGIACAGGAITAYELLQQASGAMSGYHMEMGDGMAYDVRPISGAHDMHGLHMDGAHMAGAHMAGAHLGNAHMGALYSDAKLGDALYSPADLDALELKAGLSGMHYAGHFPAVGMLHSNSKPYSKYAGKHGHRWGWLLKVLGEERFAKLCKLPKAKRKALIAKLKATAIQSAQQQFDASMPSANEIISTEGLAFSGTASVGAAL